MNFLENGNKYEKKGGKYWYLLPHHIVYFFLEEWREEKKYRLSLSQIERHELSNRTYQNFMSFCFSLMLHLILILGVVNGVLEGSLINKSEEVVSLGEAIVDVEVMGGMLSGPVDPIYDPKSDIVIKNFSLNRYKIHKKMTALEELLQKLSNKKISILSKNAQSRSTGSNRNSESRLALVEKDLKERMSFGFRKNRRFIRRNQKFKQTQLWNRVNLAAAGNMRKRVMNNQALMKVIDKHIFYFRECYEQALLKDEKLTVNAHFLLKLSKAKVRTAQVDLVGRGGFSSKKQMSHCLSAQSKNLNFADNKQNVSVKFSLIFGI